LTSKFSEGYGSRVLANGWIVKRRTVEFFTNGLLNYSPSDDREIVGRPLALA
jgi:hypothetical protein